MSSEHSTAIISSLGEEDSRSSEHCTAIISSLGEEELRSSEHCAAVSMGNENISSPEHCAAISSMGNEHVNSSEHCVAVSSTGDEHISSEHCSDGSSLGNEDNNSPQRWSPVSSLGNEDIISTQHGSSVSSLGHEDKGTERNELQILNNDVVNSSHSSTSELSQAQQMKIISSLATKVVLELISHIPFQSKLSLDLENLSIFVNRLKQLAKSNIRTSAIPDREKVQEMVIKAAAKDLLKAASSPKKLLEDALCSPEDAEAFAEIVVTRLSFFLTNPPKSMIQRFFLSSREIFLRLFPCCTEYSLLDEGVLDPSHPNLELSPPQDPQHITNECFIDCN